MTRVMLEICIQNWNSHKSVSAMHPHPQRSPPPPPEWSRSRSVLLRVHVLLSTATLLLPLVNKPPSLSSSPCRRLHIAAQVCDRGVQHLHQQGPYSVLGECLQTLRNDSFDSREREILLLPLLLLFFLHLCICLFIHLAECMTRVILERDTIFYYYYYCYLFIHLFIPSFI